MKRSRIWLSLATSAMLVLAACSTPSASSTDAPEDSAEPTEESPAPSASEGGGGGEAASVQLQLQWAPQAQFAGYFAAVEQGYYEEENLTIEILDGGLTVPQQSARLPTATSSRSRVPRGGARHRLGSSTARRSSSDRHPVRCLADPGSAPLPTSRPNGSASGNSERIRGHRGATAGLAEGTDSRR